MPCAAFFGMRIGVADEGDWAGLLPRRDSVGPRQQGRPDHDFIGAEFGPDVAQRL